MTEIKVCGICRAEDAAEAAAAGAAWLGVILAPGFARSRTVRDAAAIFAAGGARRVGVFVDVPAAQVIDAARLLELDAVQLHGAESAAAAADIRAAVQGEIWKSVPVRRARDVAEAVHRYAGVVDGLLLEGWSERGQGGVGARFDWSEASDVRELAGQLRLIVAGGLTPDNVAVAVSLLRPAIADVSSGVEEETGRKSAALMHAFVAAVRGVKDSND